MTVQSNTCDLEHYSFQFAEEASSVEEAIADSVQYAVVTFEGGVVVQAVLLPGQNDGSVLQEPHDRRHSFHVRVLVELLRTTRRKAISSDRSRR